jgi:hypothetical protein
MRGERLGEEFYIKSGPVSKEWLFAGVSCAAVDEEMQNDSGGGTRY